MTYAEKLKDPRWQKKRLEILERDHWACRDCGAIDKTLQVHHSFYGYKTSKKEKASFERGEPWDITSFWLLSLCNECHKKRTYVEQLIQAQTHHYTDQQLLKLGMVMNFIPNWGDPTGFWNIVDEAYEAIPEGL